MVKFSKPFKGSIIELKEFFNSNYKGEDFDIAFQGKKKLKIGQNISSYDSLFMLYRSLDGKYVLFERQFEENPKEEI